MVHFTLTQHFSSLEKNTRSLVVFHFKLVIKGESVGDSKLHICSMWQGADFKSVRH